MIRIDDWLFSYATGLFLVIYLCHAYAPRETQCPQKLDRDIFSLDYWVSPGTPYRAWRSLPQKLFTIKQSNIPKAGMGVFANTFIPKHTWLGEYEGEFWNLEQGSRQSDFSYTWLVYTDDELTHYVDAKDDNLSNWVRFINCPRHISEETVRMHTCYGRVYYRTRVDLAPGTELMVYYGEDYARNKLKIDTDNYYNMSFATTFRK